MTPVFSIDEWTSMVIQPLLSKETLNFITSQDDCSIGSGTAGIALSLLQLYIDTHDDQYVENLESLVRHIGDCLHSERVNGLGVFGGLTGIYYLMRSIYTSTGNCESAYKTLRALVYESCTEFVRDIKKDSSTWKSCITFDGISGLAGILRVLIDDEAMNESLIEEAANVLIGVSDFKHENGIPMPGWYTPPELLIPPSKKELYPRGWIDCGLAHGISGPLAVLSVLTKRGIYISGAEDAIVRIVDFLHEQCSNASRIERWTSTTIPVGDTSILPLENAPRPGWCYGLAGVAAGINQASQIYKGAQDSISLAALLDISLKDPVELGFLSPTICHGYAGFVSVIKSIIPNIELDELLGKLHTTYFDFSSPARYRNVEVVNGKTVIEDNFGLLNGLSGILTLKRFQDNSLDIISPIFLLA